ncbi:hypothetical protein RRG08_037802 [Elysia crispata]|uniref:Uncharacterized protein n=1 Tax=Elysia crispata TaxID=231223 RepID=A0AAE1EDC9_9GAST|nr:hypothetical protein RRG08_037802 [Elysia crispata]
METVYGCAKIYASYTNYRVWKKLPYPGCYCRATEAVQSVGVPRERVETRWREPRDAESLVRFHASVRGSRRGVNQVWGHRQLSVLDIHKDNLAIT